MSQTDLPIQDCAPSDIPSAVRAYIDGTNSFDLDRTVAAFADDALVNDQRREYVGRSQICDWVSREIVGDRVTMFVTGTRSKVGNVVVTAQMDGDYDKGGLPDPLVLTFYFSVADEHISQLIILHNKPSITL